MIINIVASSSFAQEIVAYRDRLRALGHQVDVHEHYVAQARGQMADLVGRMSREHGAVKKEYDYIRYHYNQIVKSDAILVLNFDKNGINNYIGPNSLMEMGFAYVHNKKIFLLNPVPDIAYADEIIALDPVVINNDLSRISK